MKDIYGKDLKVGDMVAFVKDNYMFTGKITKFYKSEDGIEECSIKGYTQTYSHIRQGRILKLEVCLNAEM